jgi:hypothetical protein
LAGESAREVARRAREKPERLNRAAELFERGADGEAATAQILAIFVIDFKNWSGRVTANGGHLRQNGYSREWAVAGAADAALAVAELAGPYGAWYVLCSASWAGTDSLGGVAR